MCFFRKKKPKVVIESKYHEGDFVRFRDNRDDLLVGYVYEVKLDKDGNIIYDIQIGGECPAIKHDIPENKVLTNKR